MNPPRWVPEAAVHATHTALLAEHGGVGGLRDPGFLEASLVRPRHLFSYANNPTLFELAAAYGFGLVRNHCFVDGNKRIALAVMDVFLQLNGYELTAPEAETVLIMEQLAAGTLDEQALATWIKETVRSVFMALNRSRG